VAEKRNEDEVLSVLLLILFISIYRIFVLLCRGMRCMGIANEVIRVGDIIKVIVNVKRPPHRTGVAVCD
jgi:hypothetical protein